MNKFIFSLCLLYISCFCFKANAQSFGGHPSDIDWQFIETENCKVIFPKGQEKKAYRIVSIIDFVKENSTSSVGEKTKKIDIVLQTNQVISNGFVTLSPYRSEFFATGFQDFNALGTIDWLDVLSVHEYRHALQYTNARKGLTQLLYILMGQTGWGLGINYNIPAWYFEGDATVSETVLSDAGRGRTPSFFKEQRALLLNNKKYTYMKARNGSYKDLLPNHYPMGYSICNYTRNQHGATVWKDILADAGKYKGIFYSFSKAMKRHTGLSSRKAYHEAYAQLEKQWLDELKTLEITPTKEITPRPKKVTNYSFPHLMKDGSIICLKNGYTQTTQLVRLYNGKEQKLTAPGITHQEYLSVNKNKAVWVELKNDIRRANRNYGVVVSYDMKSGKKKYLTKKTKLFSPEISPVEDKIAVVKADENLKNSIQILDATAGNVIEEIANPENLFISFPKWTNDGRSLVYIAKKNSSIALMKYSFANKSVTQLTSWTKHVIANFDMSNDRVFFSASFSGIDNIYAVDLNGSKTIKQVTSVKIGAYMPSVSSDGKTLVMSEFTDMGYALTKTTVDFNSLKSIDIVLPAKMERYNVKTTKSEYDIFPHLTDTTYQVEAYKGLFNGIKLHSWGINGIGRTPGAQLKFANILSHFSANVAYTHNLNEKTSNVSGEIKYGKWFTELAATGKQAKRSTSQFSSSDKTTSEDFTESTFGGNIALPLTWVNGNYSTALSLKGIYNYHKVAEFSEVNKGKSFNFNSAGGTVTFSNTRRAALQNVFPKFGQVITTSYSRAFDGINAEVLNIGGTLYLPGIFANDGVKVDGLYSTKVITAQYQFEDTFDYSRGYDALPFNNASKVAVNYQFPLAYPDWGFGGLVYLNRIRTNLFYDAGMAHNNLMNKTYHMNSTGFELMIDNKLINLFSTTVGLRQSFLLNTNPLNKDNNSKFEFFFTVGI